MKTCTHLDQIRKVEAASQVCEECEKTGQTWNDLYLCLICGNVACSDDSPGQHAKAHYQETDHPLVEMIGPREDTVYCYPDEMIVENVG